MSSSGDAPGPGSGRGTPVKRGQPSGRGNSTRGGARGGGTGVPSTSSSSGPGGGVAPPGRLGSLKAPRAASGPSSPTGSNANVAVKMEPVEGGSGGSSSGGAGTATTTASKPMGVRPKFVPKMPQPKPAASSSAEAQEPGSPPFGDGQSGHGGERSRGRGRGGPRGGGSDRGGRPRQEPTASGPWAYGPAAPARGASTSMMPARTPGSGSGSGSGGGTGLWSAGKPGSASASLSAAKPEPDGSSPRRIGQIPRAADIFSDDENMLSDEGSLKSPTLNLGSPDMLGIESSGKRKKKKSSKKEPKPEPVEDEGAMDWEGGVDSGAGPSSSGAAADKEPLATLLAGSPAKPTSKSKSKSTKGKQAAAQPIKPNEEDMKADEKMISESEDEKFSEHDQELGAIGHQLLDCRADAFSNLMFLQLPSVVPKVRNTVVDEPEPEMAVDPPVQEVSNGTTGTGGTGEENDDLRELATPRKVKRRDFIPLDEFHGRCGKLVIRKSGKTVLKLNSGLEYQLSRGSAMSFLQHLVLVDAPQPGEKSPIKMEGGGEDSSGVSGERKGDAMVLGRVKHRVIASPDVSALLKELKMRA